MKKYYIISFNIIISFLIMILGSFIPDKLHDFFGDWLCKGTGNFNETTMHFDGCNYIPGYITRSDFHDPTWHWGWRHWLFLFMCICLFIVNVIRMAELINKVSK